MAGLLVGPTGSGKSVVLAALARRMVETGGRALVLSHVAELIAQDAAACIRQLGPDAVGIFSAGLDLRQTDRAVTVASIQSVYRQAPLLGPQDLVLVDEAHLINPEGGTGMYRSLLADLQKTGPAPLIGLTATPFRLASGRLDRPWKDQPPLFDRIVHEVGICELIADGYLVRPIAKSTRARLKADGVAVRQGEFMAAELQAAVNVDAINRAIVTEVIKKGRDRRSWLVFAAGVAHAHALTGLLRDAGIPAAAIDGTTPSAERKAIIADFKRGEIRALVSMNVLTTGFDAPTVDLIALCRPTLSPGLHVQMIGRGTRLSSETGKADCLVLDFAGNTWRHGPLDLINGSGLAAAHGRGQAPVKACPDCESLIPTGCRTCPDCGHVFEFTPKETQLSSFPMGARMLSDDAPAADESWLPVRAVRYSRHFKEGRPASIRVQYDLGLRTVSEWWAFDSASDVARRIARDRWRRRSRTGQVPFSTNQALGITRDLATPMSILVRPDPKNADWLQVVDVRFDDIREVAA